MAETRIRLDKQIQKALKVNQFPLSDANGELQYADIGPVIKTGETLTRLDSVEILSGNLVIKYTAEDGKQQVVSTKLTISQQDISVSDAKLENPSAGVYRLLITETDGTVFPVDLSALLAVVSQNTQYITVTGNGTPASPLKIDLSATFWGMVPKVLDDLTDTTVNATLIDAEIAKQGDVALVWYSKEKQWMPKSVKSLRDFLEATETFRDLVAGNTVTLLVDISQIVTQSIKVFRNGLRLEYGQDYTFGAQGTGPKQIVFTVPFTSKYAEKVIVDYRPATI